MKTRPSDLEATPLAVAWEIHGLGRTSSTRDVPVPQEVAPGPYRIRVGLYDAYGTHERLDLEPEQGVFCADYRSYEIGTVRVE